MRKLLFLIAILCAGTRLPGQDATNLYAGQGQLILTNFVSAPFPHPKRANGHVYHDKTYTTEDHYSDSHVALFVPKGFRAGSTIDLVVHFHGWNNNVTNVLRRYNLINQFVESGRNAILIVPQGPLDANDSFGGKMEDARGFKKFIDEAIDVLQKNGISQRAEPYRIILSSHSGGYEAVYSIVARGGMSDKIREIWLFDSLYAGTETFAVWFDHHKGRFIDLYTKDGGTTGETFNLMEALRGNNVSFFEATETNSTAKDLRDNHLVFLFTDLPHDEVMQGRNTFRQLLETSSLDAISGWKPTHAH